MRSQRDDSCCKIGRVTTEYDVLSDDSRLAEEWRNGTSVRQLTEDFNKDIVKSELSKANVSQVEWSQTPVYEALHTGDLSDAERIEIRRELARSGIDVDQLSSNLVSHQTLYRHLTQCLGASKDIDSTPDERREKAKATVFALQQRTEAVTESTIEQLKAAEITNLGDIEAFVNIQIVCTDCSSSLDFETAITHGCNCKSA